ncbi:cobyrinate a,c-diamide synthase [Carboxylicivirga sp. N1Y90]|uniref:cobyrinate a,c-diamide synthase n=1 Tax=Carboxylicivirga fragile TaxID=3417571 RepID=UPI003D32AB66|nr:cobyrinate a,c-diamide synthase [Marinilabiliaceae bacterium N1Y90]
MKHSSFLIAAPKSNSGKTMVTLGLIQALVKRGLKVQPFKSGPDYIDPMHHTKVAGQASYNLDLWMSNKEHVEDLYQEHASKSEVSIIEGVMGLFDGAKKDEGSSAALACMLDVPVILVVDASSVAYSIAPLLYGFKHFNKEVKIAGVIFNKVAGEGHFEFLKEAAIDAGVEVLGYMPRDERLAIESRHLGLHLPGENKNLTIVETAAELLEQHVNIERLLQLTHSELHPVDKQEPTCSFDQLTIALANDEAFNFSYRANRDALDRLGNVIEFSPLNDKAIPKSDLLWLPGGYPELFAGQLANNKTMHQSIHAHIDANKAVIAECGGMMYLGNQLITKDRRKYRMAGVFDFDTSFETMKLHLGYRLIKDGSIELKGHEFHYSEIQQKNDLPQVLDVKTARGRSSDMAIYRRNNCWASYMHLYLGETEHMINFLKQLGLCQNKEY